MMDELSPNYDKLEKYIASLTPEHYADVDRRLLEQGISCLRCVDDGFTSLREDGQLRRKPCEDCAEDRAMDEAQRSIERRKRYAELPGVLVDATFASFRIKADAVRAIAVERADNYAAASERVRPWLVLVSKPGTGKTHLAAAIVNYRILHPELPMVKFIETVEWLDALKRGYDDGSYNETMKTAMVAPCLVLDDLGAEYHKRRQDHEGWATSEIYRVVNYRYVNRLPTIFTSNVSVRDLPPRIADRMRDEGTQLVETVLLETTSYRTGE